MTAYSMERGHRVTGHDPETSGEDPAVICLRLHTFAGSPGAFINVAAGRLELMPRVFTPEFTQLTDRRKG